MKLRSSRIEYIAGAIVRILAEEEFIIVFDKDDAVAAVASVISDDLSVEDQLDEEVRKILEDYEKTMDLGNIQYHEMFKLVKAKLIKQRGLIL